LKEAASRGFKLTIFDDDFSVYCFAPMAHGGFALPKISFLLDDTLEDGEVIEWTDGARGFSWTVDRRELDKPRDLIDSAERLPNLGAVLAMDQLPYRVVAIKDSVGQRHDERISATAG